MYNIFQTRTHTTKKLHLGLKNTALYFLDCSVDSFEYVGVISTSDKSYRIIQSEGTSQNFSHDMWVNIRYKRCSLFEWVENLFLFFVPSKVLSANNQTRKDVMQYDNHLCTYIETF